MNRHPLSTESLIKFMIHGQFDTVAKRLLES
jgi:hypothetical protein